MTFSKADPAVRLRKISLFIVSTISCIAFCVLSTKASADPHLPLRQVASNARSGQLIGQVDGNSKIAFDILIPFRNQTKLTDLISRIYRPSDPEYKRYLTPGEFNDQFAATDETVAQVANYAMSNELSVVGMAKNRSFIRVAGSAAHVEKMLSVKFSEYADSNGLRYYAPDSEPVVSDTVKGLISGFAGLSTSSKGHPDFIRVKKSTTVNKQELLNYTGNNGLSPSDIKKIYGLNNSTYNGAGTTVALFEQGTFYPSDPEAYQTAYGLPTPTYTPVSVDGYNTNPTVNMPNPTGAETEADLDLELLSAIAPGVSQVKIYEADDTGAEPFVTEVIDALNLMANDPNGLAQVVSISYGESEQYDITQTEAQAENAQLEQLAAQGQSVLISSGDSGAYDYYGLGNLSADDPGVQPLATDVGGTNLFDTASEQYEAEEGWSDPANGFEGGGGGISAYWPTPSYQVGAFSLTNNPQGSLTNRNEPDVALFADPTNGGYSEFEYDLYSGGQSGSPWIGIGGTSCATPLWAGFIADVDQALNSHGAYDVGFANPLLYQIAESPSYNLDFNDIVLGDNLYYQATPGYDNATGWGSFKANTLFASILSQPFINVLTPSTVVVGSGSVSIGISGSSLSSVRSGTWNGHSLANLKVVEPTLVTATIPAADLKQPASAPIILSTSTQSIASNTLFTVYGGPSINQISPASGVPGTKVVVSGAGFVNLTSVTLNGKSVTPVIQSPTSFTFIVPVNASTGPIAVTSALGHATGPKFTVAALPIVNHIFPAFSYTSDPNASFQLVYITGTGLSNVTDVTWEGQDLGPLSNFLIEDDSFIEAGIDVAAATSSSAPLTLISPAGNVNTPNYTVLGSPQVSSFTPTAALPGATVTVFGTNLQGVTEVYLSGIYIAALVNNVTPTSLTFVVPSGAATGPITVQVPGAIASSAGVLTILTPPTITSFTPSTGPAGTVLTITGTSLIGSKSVLFTGGATAVPTNVTATTARVVVPSGALTGPISIMTPAGTGVSQTPFTLNYTPGIASFSPTSGQTGTPVTVYGSGFNGTTSAAIGRIAANYKVVSNTVEIVIVPKGASSSDITITTHNGTATSATKFTVN